MPAVRLEPAIPAKLAATALDCAATGIGAHMHPRIHTHTHTKYTNIINLVVNVNE